MKAMKLFLVSVVAVLLLAKAGEALTGTLIYEGVLTGGDGDPVADGTYAIAAFLYEEEMGGKPVWGEMQEVVVLEGAFRLFLGSRSPIDLELERPYWLGIRVENDEELPRIRVVLAPLSGVRAKLADGNQINGDWATVAGGYQNAASGRGATVGGGRSNTANQLFAIVAGGYRNKAGGRYAAVGGGGGNAASGQYATVDGGKGNIASGVVAVVSGGESSAAYGDFSAVAGGRENKAVGDYSFAGGRRAKALHDGTFVWADTTDSDFNSRADNQFLIRATGGVGINTGRTDDAALTVAGDVEVQGKLKVGKYELKISEEAIAATVSGLPDPGEILVVRGAVDGAENAALESKEQGAGTRPAGSMRQ